MRNDKEIINILDLVAGYHRSIKLELERGGFGADVFHSETKLYDLITSDTENYMCDWSSNKYLTQQAANFIDYCFNYMRNNEDSISKKSNYYLTVLEFLDNCLNNIKLTTGIEPKPERQVTPEPQPEPKQRYFDKAIEMGFMEKTESGYKWMGSKASLGYFISIIHGSGINCEQIPYKHLEELFGVKRLDRAVSEMADVQKPQKWRGKIDKLKEEAN